ncbi:MAG TPA: carboxypeptidase regulatory-like domain-containing protein [Vicinamibacterales bacterium]|nr:carboxypeptidase regulatory-like domain-containing protein [Vicinamibacterales bacterium]
MRSLLRVFFGGVVALVLLPSSVWAQAAITGVVKDASGAVLPGVTVEAASPALIERVRSAVTDGTGQYRIVDLRPGTYSVTFTLTGFTTVKREGIELSGTFVATVNGDLRVGAIQETVTVTGESPIVDVQSAKAQTTINRDIISAIPTSRNVGGLQAVIPGMVGLGITDSGGINGGSGGSAGSLHGGRPSDSRTMSDGLNMGWAGANSNAAVLNSAGAQEIVVSTSGGLGEAETAGVVLNVVPRDGGNTFSGTVVFDGASGSMQGSNYTQALKDAGLRSPAALLKVWEINPMGGGRIIRDKLWFYLSYRETYGENTIPGMWFNRNGGDPTKWLVDFDTSRPAFSDVRDRTYIGRLTWQATPRNKFTFQDSEQYSIRNKIGGGSSTRTPEAQGLTLYTPGHTRTFTWTSPFTNRMLFEAGWGSYMSNYANDAPRVDGLHNNALISVLDQGVSPGTGITGLTYRFDNPLGGGFQHHQIGTLANLRASVSYVTGAHNLKVGYMGGFSNPSQSYYNFTPFVQFRFNGGVPNQLTETAQFGGSGASAVEFVRNLAPTSFYAQDQWTNQRLTLQGGVRYDYILTSYPDSCVGGPDYPMMPTRICYPARSTPGVHWHDVTPRIGAAYDLFGDGKTAVKVSIGKYMQALTASNSDMDLNPLIRLNLVTTRSWNDRNNLGINGDYIPQCDLLNPAANGECGPMDNQNFGKEFFTRTFDPNFINGYGKRPYTWDLGVAVQHEVAPRIGATIGYYRRWFGNFYTLDNTLTAASDYTQFSVPIPVDPRLPGGGGGVVSGIYNVNFTKVGQVQDLAQLDRNFGAEPTEYWHGFDTSVNARLRNGLIVQGGTSTGRTVQDNCALRSVVPETYNWTTLDTTQSLRGDSTAGLTSPYCRIVTPFQTSFRGLATYVVPKLDVQVAATWRSDPGPAILANYVVTNAVAAPLLGRNLSACPAPTGACNATITVNVVPSGTLYGDRINNLDFRAAKIFRVGRTRLQAGVDIYNVLNSDAVLTYNPAYSTAANSVWPAPATIATARYAKINVQVDF